jgi:hypothetical protein
VLLPTVLAPQTTAAEVRARADRLVVAKRYSEASAAFLEASRRYGALGDPNAAQILRDYSRRYRTDASLYVDDVPQPSGSLARLEPSAGCYLGASVEREDGANRDPGTFNVKTGRDHALFFMYRSFGREFPTELARKLRRIGAGLQIAWEPKELRETEDARYLTSFMQAASRSGIPVFLRFASEMNGNWTRYHGDPAAYREAFRRVAAIAHAIAPNVAMVWCPADSPERNLDDYFPGEEAVDWVGVNFYSVLYNDGDRGREAAWRHPEDSLDTVYRKYSSRHPMMVGEWAATRRSVVPRPDFAAEKIRQFYSAVPRLYPRVKAVHWLSANTMQYAQGTRRLNDFTLLGEAAVTAAYRESTDEPFYIGRIGEFARTAPRKIRAGENLARQVVLSAYARSYVPQPRVTILVDGKTVLDDTAAGAHRVPVTLSPGKHRFELIVRDNEGRIAGKQSLAAGTL